MENKKPKQSLLMLYGTVREQIQSEISRTLEEYPVPMFMAEGILSAILADMRSNIIAQLSGEREMFDMKTDEYYKAELEKQREQIRQMTEEFEGVREKEKKKISETGKGRRATSNGEH